MLGYDWPRFHAAVNDLPAALLFATVLFDVAAGVTKRASLQAAALWTLWAGVVGGWVAALAGLQAEEVIEHGEAIHDLMETHETLALTTMGIFTAVLAWKLFRRARLSGGEELGLRVLSLAGFVGIIWTAVLGGKLVFEHAAGIPNATMQAEMTNRAAGHPGGHASAVPALSGSTRPGHQRPSGPRDRGARQPGRGREPAGDGDESPGRLPRDGLVRHDDADVARDLERRPEPRNHGEDPLLGRPLRAGREHGHAGSRVPAALRSLTDRAGPRSRRTRGARRVQDRGAVAGEIEGPAGRDHAVARRADAQAPTSPRTQLSITSRSIIASRQGTLAGRIVRPSTGSLPATSRRPVIMSRSHATATTARGRRSRITRRASWPRVATNTGTS